MAKPRGRETSRTAKIRAFWDWFVINNRRLLAQAAYEEVVEDELNDQLARIHPELCGVLATEGLHPTLVIGSTGKYTMVPLVQKVVRAAPDLHSWEICAFLSPHLTSGPGSPNGPLVPTGGLWCQIRLFKSGLALGICLNHISGKLQDLCDWAFVILETCYGEDWLSSHFAIFELVPLPPDPLEEGLVPIDMVPFALERLAVAVSKLPKENTRIRFGR